MGILIVKPTGFSCYCLLALVHSVYLEAFKLFHDATLVVVLKFVTLVGNRPVGPSVVWSTGPTWRIELTSLRKDEICARKDINFKVLQVWYNNLLEHRH